MDYGLWGGISHTFHPSPTVRVPVLARADFNLILTCDSVPSQLHNSFTTHMNSVLLSPTPTAGPRPGRPDWRVDELWMKYIRQSISQLPGPRSFTTTRVPGTPRASVRSPASETRTIRAPKLGGRMVHSKFHE